MLEKFKNTFLQNRGLKQTMFKNVFWLFVSQVSRLLRVIILLYAARVIGASEYGVFSYILGIVGLFSIFADMGINPLIVRDAARNKDLQNQYFATSFWIKIFLTGITSLVFFIFSPQLINAQSAILLIPLASLLIVFDNIRDFIIAYLRGLEKMERETLIVTILNITLAVFGFFALISIPTAKHFFAIYVISSMIATCAALLIAKQAIRNILGGFSKKIALEIFKNGWPIAVSGAFSMIMLNIDIFMLGLWSTTTSIGLYAAGQKIIQVLYTVPALLASGTFPTLAVIVKQEEKEKEKNLNEKLISIILLITIPLVVGGIVLAEPIFKLLFGHEYVAGVPAFILLLINTLFIFPGVIISNLILAHNRQKKVFKFIILASLTNIILNFFLITRIDIVGSALSTLIAQIITLGFSLLEIKKVSSFEVLIHIKKMILSSIIMGVASFVLNLLGVPVLLNITLSAIFYFGILWMLKEKMFGEIKALLRNLNVAEIDQGAL